MDKKTTILCLPGLGGHRSVFNGYSDMIPDQMFRYVEMINWQDTMKEIEQIAREREKIIIMCNCYGTQLALRLIEKDPSSVIGLILIEPVFAEFYPKLTMLNPINSAVIKLMEFTDRIGLRRKKFDYPIDYRKLSKYPMFIQPFFDMRWQNMTDYFKKIKDVLTFKLPQTVNVKTLFILSSKGYLRSPKTREKIYNIFKNHDSVEIRTDTHNIVALSRKEIAGHIKNWLNNL